MGDPVLYGIIIFFILAIICVAVAFVLLTHRHKKKMEDILVYQINANATIDISIVEVLELLISECFKEYRIISLEHLNEGYINSEREAAIRQDLVDTVTMHLSSAMLDKLSLFYNIQNIGEILANKIYIVVMNYVADHNKQFMDPQ